MPVPDFDHNGVIPPHLGNPVVLADLSPYPSTCVELCEALGTTPERRAILQGLLNLRGFLRHVGFVQGFQWLDGSFVEDVEHAENRPPGDIDVVTFVAYPMDAAFLLPGAPGGVLADRAGVKQQFRVDHFVVNLIWDGPTIVEFTRYWAGLFSHSKATGVWKGMLRLELDTAADDAAAVQILTAANTP